MTGTEFVFWTIVNFWLFIFGTVGVLFVITCLVHLPELFDELSKAKKQSQVSDQEPPKIWLKGLQDRNRKMRARSRIAAQRTSELINDDDDEVDG